MEKKFKHDVELDLIELCYHKFEEDNKAKFNAIWELLGDNSEVFTDIIRGMQDTFYILGKQVEQLSIIK